MSLKAKVEYVNIQNLFLDPNNFRLIHDSKYKPVDESKIKDDTVQKRTMDIICGNKNENISDLMESFLTNGYLPVDQIQVRKLDGDDYLVLEGNRRTATLKVIAADHSNSDAFDAEILNAIPVVVYEGTAEEINHLIVMGLKHISGNKKWGEWNQAEFVKKLYDEGMDEDKICSSIGISKQNLRKNLRALWLIDQYKKSDFGDNFKTSMFPIFREAIGYVPIKYWLGWNEDEWTADNDENRERFFSLLSKSSYVEDDSDIEHFIEPAITKREEIRTFSYFVNDERAVKKLEETRNISEAYNISKAGIEERTIRPQEESFNNLIADIETLKQIQLSTEYSRKVRETVTSFQTHLEKQLVERGEIDEDVFYDTIDCHFSSLEFVQYKQFSNLKIENLKRINIIAGNNNAGKTSFLEAVYLLCKQNSFSGIHDIVRNRIKTSKSLMDYELFKNQIHSKYILNGVFDKKKAVVMIENLKENPSDFESASYITTTKIYSCFEEQRQNSWVRLFFNKDPEILKDSEKILCPVALSNPFFLNENKGYAKYYQQSVKSKTLNEVIGFIKDNISNTIEDIRLVNENQRFLVTDSDENFPESLDISAYGEGLQRIFYISLLFASVKNGVLLIDEFEDAIHVQLLTKFASFVEKLAKRFNVQVFITSHSKECIAAFMENVEDIKDVSCYALVKENGNTVVRYFDGADYKYLLNSGDYDLRLAK